MFDMSKFSMDKFVHTFIQNLGLRIKSRACKKFNKITFISHVDNSYRIKQLLMYSAEKMKEINMQQNLDFSNEKNMKYFIEKHTCLFDKLIYSNDAWILTSHLKNINAKILQKIKMRKKHNEGTRKGEVKTGKKNVTCNKKLRRNVLYRVNGMKKSSLSSTAFKEKYISFHNYKENKFKKLAAFESSKLYRRDIITPNDHESGSTLETDNDKQKTSVTQNLVNSMINIAKKEIEMTEKFLRLYIKDVEYIKKNVQVTLHVAKNLIYNHDVEQVEYNQVLCHHAILCLIEPSKKGVVLIEDNLSIVIQKYLLRGYKYHFEFQRDSKDCYTALLILNQWAKVLVKHMNTTTMHTICGILRCDVQKILVLYNSKEK